MDYAQRLARVSDYIYDHLDDEIDLARLAEVACLSPYHWHRIYCAQAGETVAATVRRLRLQRAAAELANTSRPVAEVAARAGYGSDAAFNRAFKAAFDQPPADYRRAGPHARFRAPTTAGATPGYDVSIRALPAQRLATVPHRGSYLQIGRGFEALFATLGARNLVTPDLRLVGLYLDDPTAVAEAELRSRAGVPVDAGFPIEAPLEAAALAAGDYAVLHHQGPYASMQAAYEWLFGRWLAGSGREAADAPVFEAYLNHPRDTPPLELRTDIHLALKP